MSLWLPPIVYMAAIFYVSSKSEPLPEVTAVVWDKLLHFIEYAGLAFLFCRALRGEALRWPAAIVAAILLTLVYAASDEWHQEYVPLREADTQDWFADAGGAAAGSLIFAGLKARATGEGPRRS